MQVTNLIRQVILRSLDLSRDPQCLIDSVPISVVQFHLFPVPRAIGEHIKPLLERRLPKNKPSLAIACIC
jgi:hypothetical protein